jgi:hypothetical protein
LARSVVCPLIVYRGRVGKRTGTGAPVADAAQERAA